MKDTSRVFDSVIMECFLVGSNVDRNPVLDDWIFYSYWERGAGIDLSF